MAKFKQPDWLFPRAMRLLALPPYRAQLLRGIVTSLGTKTEMAVRTGTSLIVRLSS